MTLRQMSLFWGIIPIQLENAYGPQLRQQVEQWAIRNGVGEVGDQMVFITGSQFVELAHTLIVVHAIEGD